MFGAVMLLVLIPLGPHDHVRLEALKFAAALSTVWAAVVLLELIFAAASLTGASFEEMSGAAAGDAAGLIQVKLLAAQVLLIGLVAIAARIEAGAARPLARVSLYVIYAINPLQAALPGAARHVGSKSDPGDAHVLAEIVRLDRDHHRRIAGTPRWRRRSGCWPGRTSR